MTLEICSSQWSGDPLQRQYVKAALRAFVQSVHSVSHSLEKHLGKLHLSTQHFSHWVNKNEWHASFLSQSTF